MLSEVLLGGFAEKFRRTLILKKNMRLNFEGCFKINILVPACAAKRFAIRHSLDFLGSFLC